MKNKISFLFILFFIFLGTLFSFSSNDNLKNNINDDFIIQKVKNSFYFLSFLAKEIRLKDGSFNDKGIFYKASSLEVKLDSFKLVDINEDGFKDVIVIFLGKYDDFVYFYELTALIWNKEENNFRQLNSVFLISFYPSLNQNVKVSLGNYFQNQFSISINLYNSKDVDNPKKFYSLIFAVIDQRIIGIEEVVKKPAIYIYPLNDNTKVYLKLKTTSSIIYSCPLYNNGWEVVVDKDGKINRKYNYLFYELSLKDNLILFPGGWVVEYNELNKCFDNILPKLGLNYKEIKDFKDYWINALPFSEYYEIRLVDSEFLKKIIDLDITPTPETLIRVMFYFRPLDSNDYNLKEPNLKNILRKGFTVVEWGGILENNEIIYKLKKDLIEATVFAIRNEIIRYKNTYHSDKDVKIKFLEQKLYDVTKMDIDSYPLVNYKNINDNVMDNLGNFGILIPPIKGEIEIFIDKQLKLGDLLKTKNMSRSGPFYYFAGINKKYNENYFNKLEPGIYKIKVFLIYKREYFSSIPNYYVYIYKIIEK